MAEVGLRGEVGDLVAFSVITDDDDDDDGHEVSLGGPQKIKEK